MSDTATEKAGRRASRNHAWRVEIRATLALAWPLAVAQVGQIAINTTDVVMIGRLGADELAASALGTWLYLTLNLFGLGVLTAVSALTAQAHGAGEPRAVRRTVRQGLWAALAMGVPFVLVMAQADWLFALFGQPPRTVALALPFVAILKWTLLPSLGFIALRFFVTALGRPRLVMATLFGGVALNALLDYALIFGNFGLPALGLEGAAMATVFVYTAMFVAMAVVVLTVPQFRRYHVFARLWRSDWPRFAQIFRIGTPAGIAVLMEIGLFAAAVYLMGMIGPDAVAAHTIAIQCAAVTFMIPLGVAQAATVRVGMALGRRDRAGIGRAAGAALAVGVGFMAAMAVTFWVAPRPIVGLFIDLEAPQNAAVIALAVQFLVFAGAFQVFDGAQAIGTGILRGVNDTRVPMLMATVSFWLIGFPVCIGLGFGLGWDGVGIWTGLSLSLVLYAGLLVRRIARRNRDVAACRRLAAAVAP
jgi:MATE family multidrug resistance protein